MPKRSKWDIEREERARKYPRFCEGHRLQLEYALPGAFNLVLDRTFTCVACKLAQTDWEKNNA